MTNDDGGPARLRAHIEWKGPERLDGRIRILDPDAYFRKLNLPIPEEAREVVFGDGFVFVCGIRNLGRGEVELDGAEAFAGPYKKLIRAALKAEGFTVGRFVRIIALRI